MTRVIYTSPGQQLGEGAEISGRGSPVRQVPEGQIYTAEDWYHEREPLKK